MTYRKIGGLHWFSFGRLRIAVCWKRRAMRVPTKRELRRVLGEFANG